MPVESGTGDLQISTQRFFEAVVERLDDDGVTNGHLQDAVDREKPGKVG